MARPGFDPERAARILVDAIALGDKTAAARHKVSEKTVGRYRSRLATDQELSEAVQRISREADKGWHVARARFLRRSLEKLIELVENATPEQMKDVTEALRVVGELEIAREALGVSAGDRRESETPATDAGGSPTQGAAEDDSDPGADR